VVAETPTPSQLAAFLRSHREQILARWHENVRERPASDGLSSQQLIDHLPALLDAIADTGEARTDDPRARLDTETAERHALERLGEGMDLSQVVVELAVLRDCILQAWDHEREPGSARPEVRFLNRSVDRAITASIDRYVAARQLTTNALDRISQVALESRRLDDLLHRLLLVLVETTASVDTGVIQLREGDELVVAAAVGLDAEADIGFRVRMGEGFSGRIAAEGRARLMPDTSQAMLPSLRGAGLRCLYGVPLLDQGRVVGVAHMGSKSAPDFSEQDKLLFETMAARAASGIVYHLLRQAAEQQAGELAATIESMPDAVIIGTRDRMTRVNQNALRLLGFDSLDELNGKLETLGHELHTRHGDTGLAMSPHEWPFARALDGVASEAEVTVRNRRTGADHVLRCAASPIEDGPRRSAVAVCTDVTERKRLQQEAARLLDEARRAITDRQHILGVVSHDLRNPLTSVLVGAEVLKRSSNTEPLFRKAIDSVHRGGRRMDRLIGDLMDITSIQEGQLAVAPTRVEMARVVEEALEALRDQAEQRGIQLNRDVAPELMVQADRDRLLQVLGNLLSNAIKATVEGSVTLTARRQEPGRVLVGVADTGPGLPPSVRSRLFEPFVRAERTAYSGLGLGLSIVRGIVDAHGGRIWVESVPTGGTAFYFTLAEAEALPGD
jgi:PAS domain S-box-containing protein